MGDLPFLFATPWPWWLIVAAASGAGVLTWRGYRRRSGELKTPLLRLLQVLRLQLGAAEASQLGALLLDHPQARRPIELGHAQFCSPDQAQARMRKAV